MTTKPLFILILACLTLTQSQQTCSNKPSLIQTGNIMAYASGFPSSDRKHSFTVTINQFPITDSGVKVTTSITEPKFSNFISNGVDFMVTGSQSQTPNIINIMLLINNDNSWTSIKITYFVSARNDIFAGYFMIGTYSIFGSNKNSFHLEHTVSGWNTPSVNSMGFMVALSGLRTSANNIPTIQITSMNFNYRKAHLSLNVTIDTSVLLEYLYFSYVIWQDSPLLLGDSYLIYSPTVSSQAVHYSGIGSVLGNNFGYNGVTFTRQAPQGTITCEGQRCQNACISTVQCVQNNGFIAGRTCFLCGMNQYYQNTKCNYITCPENMTLINRRCICKTNYFLINPNTCSPCPLNAHWNNDECLCNEGFFKKGVTCVTCPANSVYDKTVGTCQCIDNFHWFDDTCITCTVNQIWKKESNSCVCVDGYERLNNLCIKKCRKNQVRREDNACICDSGFNSIGGFCTTCPQQSMYIPQIRKCICRPGLFLYNNQCISCGVNQAWSYTLEKCQCLSEYYPIDNQCKKCEANSSWNGQECLCADGFHKATNNSCFKCADHLSWNGTACACPQNMTQQGNACVCIEGLVLMGDKCLTCPVQAVYIHQIKRCICRAGLFLYNNTCISCGKNEGWSYSRQECLCLSGFNKIDGLCQQCQKISSAWDGQQCVCLTGFDRVNNTSCIQCKDHKYWNGSQCICKPTFASMQESCFCPLNSKLTNQSCICNGNMTLVNGSCVQPFVAPVCAQNQELINDTCVCRAPFEVVSKQCTICPQKSASNGTHCICIRDFFKINQICTKCDVNTLYDQTAQTCTCRPGFYGDYTQCLKCHNSCKECNGKGNRKCLVCKNNRAFQNGRCILKRNIIKTAVIPTN